MRLIARSFKCNNCMGEIWGEAGAYYNTPLLHNSKFLVRYSTADTSYQSAILNPQSAIC
ncbi:MAG: hypothetical protein NUV76_06575 [Candidatus Kuenenia sp.]|nr:hypothetical protein [Candidatus Kuenenia sp.]